MAALDRVFHNRTGETVHDTYGCPVGVRGSRVRHAECRCPIPCKVYRCAGCRQLRPWCCGGHPDVRCDHCTCRPEGAPPLPDTAADAEVSP